VRRRPTLCARGRGAALSRVVERADRFLDGGSHRVVVVEQGAVVLEVGDELAHGDLGSNRPSVALMQATNESCIKNGTKSAKKGEARSE
jgi:hypothetical protein